MDDVRCRERRCLVALHLVPGVGAVRIASLVRSLGSAHAAWTASRAALESVASIGPRVAAAIVRGREVIDVDRELRRADESGARVVTWLDAGYPGRLRGIPAAPPVLYVRGAWAGQDGPAVAIVGTRRASAYGLGIAAALGGMLAGAGVAVVSGLARGIDGAAHAATVSADGVTVGVLACGVDLAYPPEHRSLMEAMLRQGGVLAEVPMGMRPRPRQFPWRNRLISGLAEAVVVVEGSVDSGALITARYATAQGRPVFAVPGSVHAAGSRGPHRLLAQGARVLDRPGDLLEALGRARAGAEARPHGTGAAGRSTVPPGEGAGGAAAGLAPAEARVLAALEDEAVAIDRVAVRARLDAAQTAAALAVLEVRGLARRSPGNTFARMWPRGTESNAGGMEWRDHSSS